jgi:hypothetical protein
MGGILGGIGSGPMQPAATAQSFASPSASAGGPVTAFAAARVPSGLSSPSPLPSHLAILSIASHANQRLAIDTENHLFFSDDAGKNWKAIPSQWKGRAVGVALISGVSTSGAATAALKMSSRPTGTTGPVLSGTMTGTVKDPSGAVIANATLVATNSSGVIVSSATSDGRGQFRMEDLAPGRYRIEAQATGFEKKSFAAEVAPAQQAVADVTLRVGSAAQTVTVQASPGPLDSTLETAKPATTLSVSRTLSRFELTTDDGERWTSIDGQSWTRE